ncbi:MAG: TRAP transporter small permease [Rhodobacteraceae bacterium]|nr:TRAP transporter small permease [Paracoccaceae bacterium]
MVEVAVILVDVVGRYFNNPLTGAQDISQMALIFIVFGGMSLCDKLGGHISVDVFEPMLPRVVIWLGDVIAPALGVIIFVLLAWTTYESAVLSRMLNLSTNIINLPKATFQYVVIAASLITALGMLLKTIDVAFGGGADQKKPELGAGS